MDQQNKEMQQQQQQQNIIDEDQNQSENSNLGKKEYWDQFYQQEVSNFNSHQEEGEIWFGKAVQKTLVAFIKQKIPKDAKILDVGCGNCQLLIHLAKNGFTNLTGCDYSQYSIQLSGNILKQPEFSSFPKIELVHCDILGKLQEEKFCQSFDFIHDKGTFDVIYLNKEIQNSLYVAAIHKLMKKQQEEISRFLITSCNTTYDELKSIFTKDGKFIQIEEVKGHKTLSFGGSTGQTVTSILFKPNYE